MKLRVILIALVAAALLAVGAGPGVADYRLLGTTDSGTRGGVLVWEAENDNYMRVCDQEADGLRVVGYLRYRTAGRDRTLFIQASGEGRCTYTNFSLPRGKAVFFQVCLLDGDGSGIRQDCSRWVSDYAG